MTQLEQVGALYIENQRLLGEYQKLLELLTRAQRKEITLDSITVDMAGLSWTLAVDMTPEAQRGES